MKRSQLVALFFLTVSTTYVLTQLLAAVTAAPEIGSATSKPSADAITEFYDAVNVFIQSGTSTSLQRVTGADFVNHSTDDDAPGSRADLVASLLSVRQLYPGLRLTPGDIEISGDLAVVHVQTDGSDLGDFLSLPLPPASAWSPLDVLRVRASKIVERWGTDTKTYSNATSVQANVNVPNLGRWTIELDRLAFDPSTSTDVAPTVFPHLFLVQSGTAVAINQTPDPTEPQPTASQHGQPGTYPIPSESSAELVAGDMLIVPATNRVRLTASGRDPLVVLKLSLEQPGVGGAAMSIAPIPAGPVSEPGIASSMVARRYGVTIDPGARTIALGRITLAPGAGIPTNTAIGTDLLLVEQGKLSIHSDDGDVFVVRGTSGMGSLERDATLDTGDGASVEQGSDMTLLNIGPDPANLVCISLIQPESSTT